VEVLDIEPVGVGRHQEAGDPLAVAVLTASSGEHKVVGRGVHPAVPAFRTVDDPLVALLAGRGVHPGGVAAVVRLGQPEGHGRFPGDDVLQHPLLFLTAELVDRQRDREVPDDGGLLLEDVVQARALAREVFADVGHREVRAALPPQLLGERKAVEARLVGPLAHLL
jgi:hypothetical protein